MAGDLHPKVHVTFTMMLCKLIIGKAFLGAKHMTAPPDGYDSCRNGARDYYVIFNPDHILPVEYTLRRDYAKIERQVALRRRCSTDEFEDDSINKETVKPSCLIS